MEQPNGLLFALDAFDTITGTYKVLKISQPDISGFTLEDYPKFKVFPLGSYGFMLIE